MTFESKLSVAVGMAVSAVSGKARPLAVSWAVTSRCNLRCKYCDIWSGRSRELSTTEAKKAIDEMASAGVGKLSLTGGEPLLRNDIGHLIEHAKSSGISVSLNTNGTLVKQMLPLLLNLDRLSVSLDGPKTLHEIQRGKGSYDKAVEAVEYAKKNGINVSIATVVTKNNAHALKDICSIASGMGVKVLFQPVENYAYSSNHAGEMAADRSLLKEAFESIKDDRNVLNSKACLRHFVKPTVNISNCGAGRIFCRIDPNGDMFPCGRTVRNKNPPNVRDGFLKGFLNLGRPECNVCYCANHVEASLILRKNISAIRNQITSF